MTETSLTRQMLAMRCQDQHPLVQGRNGGHWGHTS